NVEETQHVRIMIDWTKPETTAAAYGTMGLSGWYTSPVTIDLDATDPIPGSGISETWYMINDGTFTLYTDSIVLTGDGEYNVAFYSVDIACNVESIQYIHVKIDKTAPNTIALPTGIIGTNGWYVSPVTIDLTATDPQPGSGYSHTMYCIDAGAWELFTAPINLGLEGMHTVSFYSVDFAGNTEVVDWVTFYIDLSDPTTVPTPVGTLGLEGWYVSPVTISLSATDPIPGSGVSYTMYCIDSGIWTTYTEPFYLDIEGYHSILYYSVDYAGNKEVDKCTTIDIDYSDPTTTLTPVGTSGLEGWYISLVTVYLEATDPVPGSGVADTYYYIDSGPWILYETSIDLPEGVWTVSFYSIDLAGNAEQPKSETIKVDITPPETLLILGSHYTDEDSIFVTSSTSFSFDFIEATSGLASTWYTINDGPLMEYVGAFTLNYPDGTYTLTYYSTDVAGNVEESKSMTVTLVSLDVISYMNMCKTDPISSFDVVMRKDHASGGYKLVATNPGQFFYCIEITNNWAIQLDTLTINAEIPADFVLKAAMPIHIYLDGVGITFLCEIEGTTITVTDIPVGSMIYVVIHLDYGLKGNLYESLESFELTSYHFTTIVSGTSGILTPPGDGLEGNYMSSASLIAHQKKTTAIAGFILRPDGSPIVGVTVTLTNSVGESYDAITDEDGFYYFVGIEVDEFTVSVIVDSQEYSEDTTTTKNELTELIIIVE
ncbi:MAG: carboxypeptidase regulatory-like domain-containing protein, partial [Candidatus Thorarchaeota archaeon]